MKSLLVVLLAVVAGVSVQAAAPPNVIFILVDDMPWYGTAVRMDPAVPGSATGFLSTPNLARLAGQGMTFSHARSAAGMCAPSRCSVLTGMMTARHLFTGNSGFGPRTDGTPEYDTNPAERSLPLLTPESQGNIRFPSTGDLLRQAGYATAHFGKWHIYGGGPAKHGFDESDGETDNSDGTVKDSATGKRLETSDDPKRMFSLTQRSIDFIERSAKAGKPFFVQISHYATHAGYQARPETVKKYANLPALTQAKGTPRQVRESILAAAMTEDLDASVGQLLDKLEALGLNENTYIFFTADNGFRRWNQDILRGAKWWLWEDGVRVPLIVRGPGVAAGSHSPVNVVGYDYLPTIAELAGVSDKVAKEVDGLSFAPVLRGQAPDEARLKRPIFFHYPHYRVSPPCSAVVSGDMKLLHFYEWPEKNFLYNLRNDLGEKNPAPQEQTAEMRKVLMDKLKDVGAWLPKPNPDAAPNAPRYDPASFADSVNGHDPEADGQPANPAPGRPRKKAEKLKAES